MGQLTIAASGQTLTVDIQTPAAHEAVTYSDAALSTPITLPLAITADQDFYFTAGTKIVDVTVTTTAASVVLLSERIEIPNVGQVVRTPLPTEAQQAKTDTTVTAASLLAATAASQSLRSKSTTVGDVVWVTEGPLIATEPRVGMVGDNSTDNATALAAAATLLASGGDLLIPPGLYRTSGGANFDATKQVRLRGDSSRHFYDGEGQGRTALIYTGTGSGTFLSAKATRGFQIENMAVNHTSASFTGKLLDLSGTGLTNNLVTFFPKILDATLGGIDHTIHTCTAVYLDGAVWLNAHNATIANASVGAQGLAAAGGQGFSNAMEFTGASVFANCDTAVLNPHKQWSFHQTTFEAGSSGTPSPITTGSGKQIQGLTFTDCGFWDDTSAGTWIQVAGNQLKVTGCFMESQATGSVLVTLDTSAFQFVGANLSDNFLNGACALYKVIGSGTVQDLRLSAASSIYQGGAVEKDAGSAGKVVYTPNRAFDSRGGVGATVTTTLALTDAAYQWYVLGGSPTVTMPTGIATDFPFSFTLRLAQDGTGSRTVTWPGAVSWGAAGAPTLSTAANKIDILTFTTVDGGATWQGFLAGKTF